MNRWASWVTGIGPDRILAFTVGTGAVLAMAVLYIQFQQHLVTSKRDAAFRLENRTVALESRLRATVAQLEGMRRHADQFMLEHSDTGVPPQTSLLRALLTSTDGDLTGVPFTLDVLPLPYTTDMVGNVAALTTPAVRRRDGLSRPDPTGWQLDAALALDMMAPMAAARATLPAATRVYFASTSGVVGYVPWQPAAASGLLDTYATDRPFTRAAVQQPDGGPVWTLRQGADGLIGTAALPYWRQGAFAGIFAVELDLELYGPTLRDAGPDDSRLALLDDEGRVLATSGEAPVAVGEMLPPELAGWQQAGPLPQAIGNHYAASRPLSQVPWHVAYIVPRSDLVYPTIRDAALSLGSLALVLTMVMAISYALMRRALMDREAAVHAERTARSASERALDDLRAAHDELDFLNREKTRFFSLISHDLRGPFNTLLGMTQELADHAPRMSAEDVADFARTTHESARRVFDLLENLLQWSRVQMSGKPFAPSVFALRELVGDAIQDVAPLAEAKEIRILDAVGDRWVLADRTMILAVLRNLLVNAVKFSHPGGAVHITSRAKGDRLEIAVTDQGVGMEEEQVRQILRPGAAQRSRPGTQGETGTGLGLTLVRDLVLRHGGGLQVDSVPGRGTTISFTVPLTAAPADSRPRLSAAAD